MKIDKNSVEYQDVHSIVKAYSEAITPPILRQFALYFIRT